MLHADTLRHILLSDTRRLQILDTVASLDLPDCWIGAGFVRNAVWDHLHGRSPAAPTGDVDVIWFDPQQPSAERDRELEAELRSLDPAVDWSVKNQARMHARNGDQPYASAIEAMRYWPETATAVAARKFGADSIEAAAPFGLEDLFGLFLRPTPRFADEKHHIFAERVATKGWLSTWPRLQEAKQPSSAFRA